MTTKQFLRPFLIFFFCFTYLISGQAEQLLPVDESGKDTSFVLFKKELLKSIRNKDVNFIKKIISKDIRYTFGVEVDKNATVGFLKYNKIEKGAETPFWKELETAIDLGCTKSGSAFVCPYVFSKWPEEGYDSFSFVAVIKKGAEIKEKPSNTSKTIRTSNFDLLKLSEEQNSNEWYLVELEGSQKGYISRSDVRVASDYRVQFQKTNSGWEMDLFIAGD
ncbi:SH3 domain-containing protein [Bdellovibrio sp. HCB288]|uniref:SH3 domain-containing protein n=1 Tax=Bdellovibrio sp. HCB288 TaxID=3394355 RepID=UPI0039B4794D